MAYVPNEWQDRIGQGLNRWRDQYGNLLILTPDPISIEQQGTPFSADLMNHIEQGIAEAASPFIVVKNVIVPTAAWTADPDELYATYPYRAAVPIEGATAAMIPVTAYSVDAINLGTISPVEHPYNGGLYIYASAIPAASITILSVILVK